MIWILRGGRGELETAGTDKYDGLSSLSLSLSLSLRTSQQTTSEILLIAYEGDSRTEVIM